jgi:mannobiose 2-epimerase
MAGYAHDRQSREKAVTGRESGAPLRRERTTDASSTTLIDELQHALVHGILERWYPLVLDTECGGYYTNVSSDWVLFPEQEKMIVSQARHIWTLSTASRFLGGDQRLADMARHGVGFLRDRMWDRPWGGFFQIRSRNGGRSEVNGWREEKRAYGNAFALYALAGLYELTGDPQVLRLAREAFAWIELHAYDPDRGGYHEFLTREGSPFDRSSSYQTIASDRSELGFKDQNSSIHLLEAYTQLFRVWPDARVRAQLLGLLTLIRDTMVTDAGYLQLFFHPDWTPVTFRSAPAEVREAHYGLDHVSFGHDMETAYLLLEASHVLGLRDDRKTLLVAKKMLDHALDHGWDAAGPGGFFDGGYHWSGEDRCAIVSDRKIWWGQAEGMNALLLFARIFPENPRYLDAFQRQWEYIKTYLLDGENGDWFEGGMDKDPHFRTGPKSHMWKCTYHTGRALMNCAALLRDEPDVAIRRVAAHWREVGRHMAGT